MATLGGNRLITLADVSGAAASGTATVVSSLDRIRRAMFVCNVTSAGTGAGDTLNVRIQKSPDLGTTWIDFVSFTQVLGNGGAKLFIAEWSDEPTPEVEYYAATVDGALAAGAVVQGGSIGDRMRVKYTIADVTTPLFTFTVTALVSEDGGGL